MSDRKVVGVVPSLPWPLSASPWWTEPVRAERLAALRIGVALVLLADVMWTYIPMARAFFGRGSLGSPEVFAGGALATKRWCILRGIDDPSLLFVILILWAVSAFFLLIGYRPRLSAVIAWTLSISFMALNYYLHNSGDNVRTIELFYLMLCPCAAVWSVDGWFSKDRGSWGKRTYVAAWPMRLLFIQLAVIYFVNGVYKAAGSDWVHGSIMHYVMSNVGWSRISFAEAPIPYPATQVLTWVVLFFELAFPVLVMMRPFRTLVLLIGLSFHIGTGVFLQIGAFPLYMMCLYLPLVPWERLADFVARRSPEGADDQSQFLTAERRRASFAPVGAGYR